MNHAIEVLKREERELEYQVNEFIEVRTVRMFNDLNQTRQAIADLEEKDMQREMAKEGGDEN